MKRKSKTEPINRRLFRHLTVFALFLFIIFFGLFAAFQDVKAKTSPPAKPVVTAKKVTTVTEKVVQPKTTTAVTPPPVATPVVTAPSACSNNTLPQLILVSISSRHLWACDGTTQLYDSPVITGMEYLAADLTPIGTYHIYGKQTNEYLKGCDSTGCWNDYVNYFLEFLHNQYGIYGFHDATWRSPTAFGNISPYSSEASHGCVELPLATAAWLYSWSSIGTTVSIVS